MPIQGIGATKEAGIVPYIQDFFTAEHAQSIQSQWGKLASILVPAVSLLNLRNSGFVRYWTTLGAYFVMITTCTGGSNNARRGNWRLLL